MKYKLFFAVASVWGVIGCAESYSDLQNIESFTVKAIIDDSSVKTTVTDYGDFAWSLGDQVWLQTSTGGAVGVVTPSDNPKVATISCDKEISGNVGVAIYPYNEKHLSSQVHLPSSYDLGSNLSNTNALMYGKLVNGEMKFQHIAGVMRFKFIDVPKGVNKFELTLDKKINGNFPISSDNPIIETKEVTDRLEKTVVLNFDELTSNSDLCLYVPLPVGEYNALKVSLSDANGVIWRYSKGVTNVVEHRGLVLMPEVVLSLSPAPQDFVNLSANGTANCYIVSNAGKYCFRLIKGNGMEKIENVKTVEVLWESRNYGTFSAGDFIKQVNISGDYVTFETSDNFKEGNALIAVRDAGNTILWSWHIWLTDAPKEQVYYRDAGVMMDRNLGAMDVYDLDALGLMYQWGRKDPFLPSRNFKKGNSDVISSTGSWKNAKSSATAGTIQYSIENPTTFITADYDWLYSEDLGENDTRWTKYKTIYDPCPPGWQVPEYTIWTTALNMSPTYKNPYCEFDVNFIIDMYSPGTSIKFCDEYSWYPAQGFKTSANVVSWPGYQGDYWSCNSTESYQAFKLSFDYNYETCMLKAGIWRVDAHPIRCVKEL